MKLIASATIATFEAMPMPNHSRINGDQATTGTELMVVAAGNTMRRNGGTIVTSSAPPTPIAAPSR